MLASVILLAYGCALSSCTDPKPELVQARYGGTWVLWEMLTERHLIPETIHADDGLLEALERSGLTFPQGSSIWIDKATGRIIMMNTEENHTRLMDLLRETGLDPEMMRQDKPEPNTSPQNPFEE